jgi:hypothetical protein
MDNFKGFFDPYNFILGVIDNTASIPPQFGKGQIMDLVCKIFSLKEPYPDLKTEIQNIINAIDETNGSKAIMLIQSIAILRKGDNDYSLFSKMLTPTTSNYFLIILKNMNTLFIHIKHNQTDIKSILPILITIFTELKKVINQNGSLSGEEQKIIEQINSINIDDINIINTINQNIDKIKNIDSKFINTIQNIIPSKNGGRYKKTMKGKRKNKKVKRKTRRNR